MAPGTSSKRTAKYWTAIYVFAAVLTIPAAVCSNQSRPLHFDPPIIVPLPSPPYFFMESPPTGEVDVAKNPDVRIEDPEPAMPFHDHIMRAALTYEVDAALIRAIIMAESGYNPKSVSYRGAQGLMQLMPTTAKWLGVHDPFDPALNIDAGVRYFKRLLDRFEGDVQLALAAYNATPVAGMSSNMAVYRHSKPPAPILEKY